MRLTNDNYFSPEASRKYFSVSQFKAFDKCEAAAMAEIRGEYTRPKTTALLVGSYVDAWFEGTLDQFKEENPEIFKKDGTLKADYIQAEEIIKRVSEDKLFMKYMSGKKQRIFTGELFGAKWKIKVDSWFKDKLVDLKCMRTLEPIMGQNFITHWGYDIQAAVYQAVEGKAKPFYIAAVTKETPADLEVISIPQYAMDNALDYVGRKMPRFIAVKKGKEKPLRCGGCPYCRMTKKLTAPIDMEYVGYTERQLREMKGEQY